MELQQIEQRLLTNSEDLATIKAKLFNGITGDISEIKTAVKDLALSFQEYKDNREETCLYRRDLKTGRTERRARVAVFAALCAIFLNMTGIILTKLL